MTSRVPQVGPRRDPERDLEHWLPLLLCAPWLLILGILCLVWLA